MFYKPKYCCNCGQEIEKTDRNMWSSGRFCDVCEDDFKPQEWIPRIIVLGGIVLSLFGFGSLMNSNEKPPNLTARQFAETAPSQKKEVKDNKTQLLENSNSKISTNINGQLSAEKQSPGAKNLSKQKEKVTDETKVSDTEPTYFCGAATKKGSPCSRRVKGGGRCWQHAGQTAILSPEKLIVRR